MYICVQFNQTLRKPNQAMKKSLLSCAVLSIFSCSVSFGQIYIDTGNPDMDNMKQENPDMQILKKDDPKPAYNSGSSTQEKTTKSIYVPANEEKSQGKTNTSSPVYSGSSSTNNPYSGNLNPANDDLPPFAEAGKCYARCWIPDQYEFVESEVLDRAATHKTQVIPATYETVFDTVIISPDRVKVEVVPAVYETITEDIMVAPATTRWERGKGDANCLSNDPKDCQVICLKEVPAQFNKVERKVVKTPAYTRQITIPAEIKIVPRKVMVKPAESIQIEIPATYKKIMDKKMVKKGGYTDWREVLCGAKLTTERIRAIQNALIAKGYSVGSRGADNVFGEDTKVALRKFQADNGLPQGNLNMETLNALGVKQ